MAHMYDISYMKFISATRIVVIVLEHLCILVELTSIHPLDHPSSITRSFIFIAQFFNLSVFLFVAPFSGCIAIILAQLPFILALHLQIKHTRFASIYFLIHFIVYFSKLLVCGPTSVILFRIYYIVDSSKKCNKQ